jgi:hypothetical protein
LINVLVVGLVALQVVPLLLAGCDLDGSCANGSGPMTWALGAGVPLVSLVVLFVTGRALLGKRTAETDELPAVSPISDEEVIENSADLAPAVDTATAVDPASDVDAAIAADAVAAVAAEPRERQSWWRRKKTAAEGPAAGGAAVSEQVADASAQSRLSRVRATAEAEAEAVAAAPSAFLDTFGPADDLAPVISDDMGGSAAPSSNDDMLDDMPMKAPGEGMALRIIPFDVDALALAEEEDAHGLGWMFDGSRLASPDETGFPWIVATIDRFCEAVIEDPGTLLSDTLRSEAEAWRTAISPFPRHELITGRDAHDFVGWANQCLVFSGSGARAMVASAMDRLCEEAEQDAEVSLQLPSGLLHREHEQDIPPPPQAMSA